MTERDDHIVAERWWRTLPDHETVEQARGCELAVDGPADDAVSGDSQRNPHRVPAGAGVLSRQRYSVPPELASAQVTVTLVLLHRSVVLNPDGDS